MHREMRDRETHAQRGRETKTERNRKRERSRGNKRNRDIKTEMWRDRDKSRERIRDKGVDRDAETPAQGHLIYTWHSYTAAMGQGPAANSSPPWGGVGSLGSWLAQPLFLQQRQVQGLPEQAEVPLTTGFVCRVFSEFPAVPQKLGRGMGV